MIRKSSDWKSPDSPINKYTGELCLIKMYKYLQMGLSDKSLKEVESCRAMLASKTQIESDCCVCFSSTNKDNNPIVYCSGEKYRQLTQLQVRLPPDLLPDPQLA